MNNPPLPPPPMSQSGVFAGARMPLPVAPLDPALMDESIPEFVDVVPDRGTMDGAKMPIEQVVNIPLVFTNWDISQSKYRDKGEDTERLTLQFLYRGEHRIAFTGSTVLIGQLREFDKVRDPNRKEFKAIIRKIDRFYKFCRTK
jgi:hypothetical protein